MTPLNYADLRICNVEGELERMHQVLFEHARRLAEQMSRLAARLEAEGVEARVNPLGEVQGAALDIDRACALLDAARTSRDAVRAAVKAAREEHR